MKNKKTEENKSENSMESIVNRPRKISDEEAESICGGSGKGGYYLIVRDCAGSLALRPQPYWDPHHILAQMSEGDKVFTYGEITAGSGIGGQECNYLRVNWQGIWGYANAKFLCKN